MDKKAFLIRANPNLPEEITPANGKDFTLEELYKLLGCDMIEIARPRVTMEAFRGYIIILDEEGKLKPNEINTAATILYDRGDVIVGDVVYCPGSMFR